MNYILPQRVEDCEHLTTKSNSEKNNIPEEALITCGNTDQFQKRFICYTLRRTSKV